MRPSNTPEFVFLGLKNRVTALRKSDGTIAWATPLSTSMLAGSGFVTVTCDADRVYCYTSGHFYCLDITNGNILWKNELSGYGYGLASVSVHGSPDSPDQPTFQKISDADKNKHANNASNNNTPD